MLEFFHLSCSLQKRFITYLSILFAVFLRVISFCYLCCQNIILRLTAQQQQHQTETKLSLSQVVHFGIMICQKHAE